MIEAPAIMLFAWLLGLGAGRGNGKKNGRKPIVDPIDYAEGVWSRAVPSGGEVPIHNTGGLDPAGWRMSRWNAIVKFLMEDDRSLNAMTSLVEHGVIEHENFAIDSIALSVLTHFDIETASGVHEYNFNVGGVLAVPGQQHFVSVDPQNDPTARVAFCAYDDLQQGIADYFGVLSYERYVKALAPLLMLPTDPGWFGELGWAGYYGMDPVQAEQMFAARRVLVAPDAGQGPNE